MVKRLIEIIDIMHETSAGNAEKGKGKGKKKKKGKKDKKDKGSSVSHRDWLTLDSVIRPKTIWDVSPYKKVHEECCIMSRHVASCPVTSCHAMSCHAMSCHGTLCRVVSCCPHHITSHHITSHHITSHHITSHHITSHPEFSPALPMGWVTGAKPRTTGPEHRPLGGVLTVSDVCTPQCLTPTPGIPRP